MPSLIRKRVSRVTGKTSWVVQIPTGEKTAKGNPKCLMKTFSKKGDAKEYLSDREGERKTGGVIKPSADTLEDYLDQWMKGIAHSLRENTVESYKAIIEAYLKPPLGKVKLAALQPLMIQRAYAELLRSGRVDGKALSARTVRYAHSVLHNALDQAVKWRLLSMNPATGVDLPKQQKREMRPLSPDEAKTFLEATKTQRLGPLFELMLITGMRPSELMGLQWDDIDFGAGIVRVKRSFVRDANGWYLRDPKTSRGKRSIPIPADTVETLRTWKKRHAEERMKAGPIWAGKTKTKTWFVFTTPTGEPLERRNLANRSFMAVLRAAGMVTKIPASGPGTKGKEKALIRPYDLRHTCATMMLSAGVNPKVASERLGHASVVITLDTYSHVLPTMQADATEKLAGILYR